MLTTTACDTPDVDLAKSWVEEITPKRPVQFELRWRARTKRINSAGRAVVKFVPPDSLRFDLRAPFGRRGAAVLLGDSLAWADPWDAVTHLIPSARLFFGIVGLPRPPVISSSVVASLRPDGRNWSYEFGDTTLIYHHAMSRSLPTLTAMLTSNGRTVGTTFVTFDSATGLPTTGRMLLEDRDIFAIEFVAIDTLWIPESELWIKRQDEQTVPTKEGVG